MIMCTNFTINRNFILKALACDYWEVLFLNQYLPNDFKDHFVFVTRKRCLKDLSFYTYVKLFCVIFISFYCDSFFLSSFLITITVYSVSSGGVPISSVLSYIILALLLTSLSGANELCAIPLALSLSETSLVMVCPVTNTTKLSFSVWLFFLYLTNLHVELLVFFFFNLLG